MSYLTPHRREILSLAAVTFLLAGLLIWIRTATVRDTYVFVQQERELRRLQQETQGARVRWLRLTSPKRLDTLARLHRMGPPRLEQVLKYEPDKTASLH